MKKKVNKPSNTKAIVLTVIGVVFIVFFLVPLAFSIFDGKQYGNVALIPLEGVITTGSNGFGEDVIDSQTVVEFIESAEKNSQVKVILLEINSPGGTPVATDEIVHAIKKVEKPVVALIREVGASGGYWVASAANHLIANRMAMTGSIGVRSSWLEFSGLMKKYGVGYEQVNAGEYKELVSPFKRLQDDERDKLLKTVEKVHGYFIEGVAENRGLSYQQVEKLATGEVFLGVEALKLGLVDELGNRDTAEEYIKENYELEKIDYITYKKEAGLFDLLFGLSSEMMFNIGQGLGSMLLKNEGVMLI